MVVNEPSQLLFALWCHLFLLLVALIIYICGQFWPATFPGKDSWFYFCMLYFSNLVNCICREQLNVFLLCTLIYTSAADLMHSMIRYEITFFSLSSNIKCFISDGKSWSTLQEVNNQSSTIWENEWSPITNTRWQNKHSSQTGGYSHSIYPIVFNECQYDFHAVFILMNVNITYVTYVT